MILPSGLATWCHDPPGRPSPALARARVERVAGRSRAARDAMGAHLVLRWVARPGDGHSLRPEDHPDRLARIRALLDVPGGPSDEARALLEIVEAAGPPAAAGLADALRKYAILLEHLGRHEESLAVLGTLLRRLESFDSPAEGCDLALSVGRLNGLLARWDRAAAALELAVSAARASGGDDSLGRLVSLGRAALWAAQGRVADAQSTLETLLGDAAADGPGESIAEGWTCLGAVLDRQGLALQALQAHHQAFEHAVDEGSRRRALAQVGSLLCALGATDAARQAFSLLLAGPVSFPDAVAARLELLELASALDDRVAFERHRLELRAWGGRLPPRVMVEFLLRAALGLARFGQRSRAWQHFEEARLVAERHGLGEAGGRLAQARARLDDPALDGRRFPIDATSSWECHEIAEVAEALQRHADSLYVHA